MSNYYKKFKIFLPKLLDYLPLLASLSIIIFISYNTFHSDFIVISKIAEKIAGGNLHIYEDLYIGAANYHIAIMPPLICLIDGLNYFLFKGAGILNFDYTLVYSTPSIQLLLLKSRYILVFILSYFLVYKAALSYTKQNPVLSRRVANLWIASPILIYLPFAQGNNDIYPVVFTMIFLFFAFRKKFILAMIFLGLAATLKSYALFLIIPAALILSQKDLKKTILYGLTSGLAFILPMIFYLKDSAYFTSKNVEGLNMLSTVIPSHAVSYSIFAIGYFLILLFLYYGDNIKSIIEDQSRALIVYCLSVMSLFYVTWAYPQWFLWILPFFVFLIYKNRKLYSMYLLICSVYLLRAYIEYPGNLDIYLWRRIFPLGKGSYYYPGIIQTNTPIVIFSAGLFVALMIAIVYFSIKNNKKDETDKGSSVYWGYLPTVILLVAIYIFYLLSK